MGSKTNQQTGHSDKGLKHLLSYWRNSLSDADRMIESQDVINHPEFLIHHVNFTYNIESDLNFHIIDQNKINLQIFCPKQYIGPKLISLLD
ncbi:hypothetical protein EV213_107169 [Aureibacillus halotolerans]|uniref:Uncharacterized protein n=1 Tax=Aureibacillus halotolerans TaxID=1508390 RepID=A0A4R6U1J7_9BACI|nr:hypothetical protein EV213_107169 [Aureibacillus halotolerans]